MSRFEPSKEMERSMFHSKWLVKRRRSGEEVLYQGLPVEDRSRRPQDGRLRDDRRRQQDFGRRPHEEDDAWPADGMAQLRRGRQREEDDGEGGEGWRNRGLAVPRD